MTAWRFEWLEAEHSTNSRTLFLRFAAITILILAGFRILHQVLFHVTALDATDYFSPIILVAAAKNLDFSIIVLLLSLALLIQRKKLNWSNLDETGRVRVALTVVVAASSWTFATYETNLYYNQSHTLDRLLLLLAPLLVYRHPSFILFYLVQGTLIVHQFHHPIPGYSWLDKRILFDVAVLFLVFLYARMFVRIPIELCVALIIALMAANYYIPGIAKLRTPWVSVDQLHNLTLATYWNGWLGSIPEARLLGWIEAAKWVNRPLVVLTLILELGFVAVLWRRRLFVFLMLGSIGLHLGILAASGIFFWKWITLNIVTMLLVAKWPSPRFLFKPPLFLVGALATVAAPLYAGATWLMWYDTNYDSYYEFIGVGDSGEEYSIPRLFFAPYDLIFAQNRFWYLDEEPRLVGTFGATHSLELTTSLLAAKSADELDVLREQYGELRYNAQRSLEFDEFMRRYFGALRDGAPKKWYLSRLQPPFHISSFARPDSYRLQEPLRTVRVVRQRRLFTNGSVRSFPEEIVREVELLAPADLESGASSD